MKFDSPIDIFFKLYSFRKNCYNKSILNRLESLNQNIWGYIMKKIGILILFIFFLVGCTQIDAPTPTEEIPIETQEPPIETPIDDEPSNYIGYASHISMTETVMPVNQRLPQKYFIGTYTKVKYTALTKELCVTAQVDDKDYRNATYYMVGRKVGNDYYGEYRVQFLIPSGVGSKTVCFKNVDLAKAYEVLLTKVDLDDLNPSNTIYSVNTLTLRDLKADERNRITQDSVIDLAPSIFEKGSAPYVLFSSTFIDPNRSIDKVHVVLFNPLNNKSLDSFVIDITDDLYEGDILKLENLRFNDVAPKLKYSIQIFADGNDGVDSFEKITIGNYTYETGTYEISTVNEAYHGLFAVVTGFEVIDDQVHIYYDFENDGNTTYTDTKQKISIIVTTFTGRYPDPVEKTIPLDVNRNSLILPKALLNDGLYLSIRDSRFQISFCDFFISPNYVRMSINENQNHGIRIYIIDDGNEPPLSIKVEIVDINNQVVETIDDVSPAFGEYHHPYSGTYGRYQGYKVKVTYDVQTDIGILTHVFYYSLYANW